MFGIAVRLAAWIRQTTTSFFAPRRTEPPAVAGDDLIYRLKYWPRIPSASKTANIYRTLSVMSNRPVNRRWILNSSSMDAREVDSLLRRLVDEGAVEVIDAGKYRPDTHAA